MEIKELNKLLCDDVLSVCKMIFPLGEIISEEYCVGSIEGEKGKSLRVHIGKGEKLGLWTDFAGGSGGDLVDLWMKSRSIKKKEAVQEIKDYLGVRDEKPVKQEYPKPNKRDKPVKNLSPVMKYLTEERKLSSEIIERYRIEEGNGKGKDWILFPSYKNDELLVYKALAVQRNGSKEVFKDPKKALPCLFGWQSLTGDERSITIDEGEINAMSLAQYGYPSLATPIGAGKGNKHSWIETEYEDLELFDTIYIRADNDEPGQEMIKELVERLGKHRCRILRFQFDPNECLQRGYTKSQIDKLYHEAEYVHPEEVSTFSGLRDRIYKRFYRDPYEKAGFVPRFEELQPDGYLKYPKFEFRYGETTVLAGYNHEGKSQIAKQLLLDAILQDERCCYADLENPEDSTGHRFVRSALACPWPSEPLIDSCINWLNSHAFIIGRSEGMTLDKIHESFLYLRRKFGTRVFVLDSLMKIEGVDEEDNENQKQAMNQIIGFDRKYQTHTILVAHFKKPQFGDGYVDFHKPPTRYQISGSAHISNQADNTVLFFRNRFKEDILKGKINPPNDKPLDSIAAECDALFSIDKQRNDESWTGAIKLWWHQESMQYLEKRTNTPFKYFNP